MLTLAQVLIIGEIAIRLSINILVIGSIVFVAHHFVTKFW